MADKVLSILVQTKTQTSALNKAQADFDSLRKTIQATDRAEKQGYITAAKANEIRAKSNVELIAARNKLHDVRMEIVKNNDALKKNSGFVAGIKQGIGQWATSMIGITAAIGLASAAIGKAIRTITEFEQSIAELSSITGASGADLEKLKNKVLEVSKSTNKSAKEVAEAFKLIGSAKPELLANADALAEVSEQAIILSKASGLDLATSSEALAKAMNQYGASAADAAKFTDILATSQQKGTAPIEKLSESLKNVGSVAKASGINFETTNALLQGLAKGGLDGAEAGTKLRTILLRLAKTGRDDLNPATQNFNDILNVLSTEVTDVTKAQNLFGEEAAAAALTLIDQRETVEKLNGALYEQGNALKQAETNYDTVSGKMEKLNVTWENFILSIEDGSSVFSDVAKGFIEGITNILGGLTDLLSFSSNENIAKFGNDYLKALTGIDLGVKSVDESIKKITVTYSALNNEQLKNRDTALQIVQSYMKLGLTKDEAIEKYKSLFKATQKNTDAIIEEKDATDKNVKSSKEKNTELERQIILLDEIVPKTTDWQESINKAVEEQRKFNADNIGKSIEEAGRLMDDQKAANDTFVAQIAAMSIAAQKVLEERKVVEEEDFRKRQERIQFAGDFAMGITEKVSAFNQNAMQKELEAAAGNDEKIAEIQKKYANREKKLASAQAIIRGALAVQRIAADVPKVDFGISTGVLIGAQIAMTAAEVAAINGVAFKEGGVLEYAKGGKLMGKLGKLAPDTADLLFPIVPEAAAPNIGAIGNFRSIKRRFKWLDELRSGAMSQVEAGLTKSLQDADNAMGTVAARGMIIRGKSHAEGGVPFTVNGRSGFEAEGGEAIINKRSTAMFRPLLSEINQIGGGRKFKEGGITNYQPTGFSTNAINGMVSNDIAGISIAKFLNPMLTKNVVVTETQIAGATMNVVNKRKRQTIG